MAILLIRLGAALALCGLFFVPTGRAADNTGYATAVRAEYVFACMATNGGTQEALQRCSCAIDVVASVLPYDKYEQAAAAQSRCVPVIAFKLQSLWCDHAEVDRGHRH